MFNRFDHPRTHFQAPYVLTVRAIDNGEESQLFTDTEVYITVGDVSSNDGVPDFERPKVDEVAYVAEVRVGLDFEVYIVDLVNFVVFTFVHLKLTQSSCE